MPPAEGRGKGRAWPRGGQGGKTGGQRWCSAQTFCCGVGCSRREGGSKRRAHVLCQMHHGSAGETGAAADGKLAGSVLLRTRVVGAAGGDGRFHRVVGEAGICGGHHRGCGLRAWQSSHQMPAAWRSGPPTRGAANSQPVCGRALTVVATAGPEFLGDQDDDGDRKADLQGKGVGCRALWVRAGSGTAEARRCRCRGQAATVADARPVTAAIALSSAGLASGSAGRKGERGSKICLALSRLAPDTTAAQTS
mgnify:CR=1 FL=1